MKRGYETEAHWSKSGYHGWWYGWKLHLACRAASVWIPLAAELTPANLVDPKTRTVTVYQSFKDVQILLEGDVLAGGDVLPGFQLALAELF